MSAPHIPNLNTFRRSGGRGRGRGRRPPVDPSTHGQELDAAQKDRIIRNTDNDAATSRLSAVEAGYLEDDFAVLLSQGSAVQRRLPLMNRGTYVRTSAIDRLVSNFLTSTNDAPRQILSLGAGSDTRFFRMRQRYLATRLLYHEFDFSSNTAAKIRQLLLPQFVHRAKTLCEMDLRESQTSASAANGGGDDGLHWTGGGSAYHLHPLDLRSLSTSSASGEERTSRFAQWGVSLEVPTLILSECCLIYLPPADADSLLSYLTNALPQSTPLGVIIYEPIRPNDAFGRTMVANLTARGIHLQTLHAHDTLAAQRKRLREHGLGKVEGAEGMAGQGAQAADVDFIWEKWVDEREKERVEGLEWMDEVEEWRLLARHYCVAWGWREGEKGEFRDWGDVPLQAEEG